MTSELTVYGQLGEVILHARYAPQRLLPIEIVDGTPEMRAAVRSVLGRDFDRTVFVDRQPQRFAASWGSPEYLRALAGYWSANFGWQTKITDVADGWSSFLVDCQTQTAPFVLSDLVEILQNTTSTDQGVTVHFFDGSSEKTLVGQGAATRRQAESHGITYSISGNSMVPAAVMVYIDPSRQPVCSRIADV